MFRKKKGGARLALVALAGSIAFTAGPARAQASCWPSRPPHDIQEGIIADVDVRFGRVYTGTYRHGDPYDFVTVDPAGTGETFEDMGISIRVRLRCELSLQAIAGMPAEAIILFNSGLCMCPGWKAADAPTDANGETTFSGTIRAGGCVEYLTLFADGIAAATLPIKLNSPDTATASACLVDASDISGLAQRLGRPDQYSICFDYNESGGINAGDVSFFAAALGRACP